MKVRINYQDCFEFGTLESASPKEHEFIAKNKDDALLQLPEQMKLIKNRSPGRIWIISFEEIIPSGMEEQRIPIF